MPTKITDRLGIKPGRAYIIHTNGTAQEILPQNGISFELEELQKIVGGPIEILTSKDKRYLIVNEEGRMKQLAPNMEATMLWHVTPEGLSMHALATGNLSGKYEIIVGPAIISPRLMVP